MIGCLPLLRGNQIKALDLLVERLRQLAVDFELVDDPRRQVFAVFRQQLGTLQRLFCFALALAVLLIAQRLQVGIELFALFLRQLRADARQLPGGC